VIIDAQAPGELRLPEVDVCVVGSGPAGTALADRLTASGRRVLVVESGSLTAAPWADELNAGEDPAGTGLGFTTGRSRVTGGGGALWWGQCVRLDDSDFSTRSWVPYSGWPITAGDLTPHYVEAERWYQIRTLPDTAELDRLLPDPVAFSGSADLRKVSTVFTRARDQTPRLLALCRGSAQTHLLHSATVTGMVLDGATVTQVMVAAPGGRRWSVRARAFVLAAGGIENARLLLAAHRSLGETGPLNSHGLVGRFLQEHPYVFQGRVLDAPDVRLQSEFGLRYARRHRFWPKLALTPRAQEQHGVLGATVSFVTRFERGSGVDALRELVGRARRRKVGTDVPRLASSVVRDTALLLPQIPRRARGFAPAHPTRAWSLVQLQLEQPPDPANRIRLGERVDSFGMALPAVELAVGDQMMETLRVATDCVDRELRARRLGKLTDDLGGLVEDDEQWAMGHHHAGTTRMSGSPRDGVVDRDCRIHGVPNLFVAGSSVFPTSGWANPTLTIVALAFRLADHLHRRGL
jgi:choline dehydrogenase-like flavoprotein